MSVLNRRVTKIHLRHGMENMALLVAFLSAPDSIVLVSFLVLIL
jgi:hypothetical protein